MKIGAVLNEKLINTNFDMAVIYYYSPVAGVRPLLKKLVELKISGAALRK